MARKKAAQSRVLLLLIIFLSSLTVFIFINNYQHVSHWWQEPESIREPLSATALQKKLRVSLRAFGVGPESISENDTELVVRLPEKVHPLIVYQRLSQIIRNSDGVIVTGREEAGSGDYVLGFHDQGDELAIRLAQEARPEQKRGNIAIVIDDFGYHRNTVVQKMLEFDIPVSYAVIPGLPRTQDIARELAQKNKAVLIHMPMEPGKGRVEMDGFTLLTKLESSEIAARVRKSVQALPQAKGLNNHMGSKATADSALMTAALTALKKAGLFYLDSRTSPNSVGYDLARKLGVPCFRNDLFIDAIDDEQEITKKLERLAVIAERRGMSIGIAHPRPKTLTVLQKVLPELQARGFRFVLLQDMVRTQPEMTVARK